MPGLARKVIVCAAIDGLIIQPLSSKGQRPSLPVRVRFGESAVSAVPWDQLPDISTPDSSFEAFGVIGLITVSKLSYLVTITRRQQVAQIFGFPIYVVTEVAVTPCNSRTDAEESIKRTAAHLRGRSAQTASEGEESSDEDVEIPNGNSDEIDDAAVVDEESRPQSKRSSVAEDVMRRRGSYGRFAQSWFSRSGWTMDQRRTMGMSVSSPDDGVADNTDSPASSIAKLSIKEDLSEPVPVSALLPKLLRTIKVLFGSSRSFYFSYDVDITRRLAQDSFVSNTDTPLYSQADGTFFWNRHIMEPFMETGQDSLALPLMQGFVGQRTFVVDSQPPQQDEPSAESLEMSSLSASGSLPNSPPSGRVRESLDLRPSERKCLITLISRRSTRRAGLRYLRRGVDEDGYTANMVETEQLLSSPTWDQSTPIHSFVQIRGSIPLFFTQSAYSLKPVPVLQHSSEANFKACKRHFEKLTRTYGALQIVNLVEKHGIEEPIGTQYQTNVERLNDLANDSHKIPFEWFDFHQACRGMKFENVNHLLLKLKGKLEDLGSTTKQDGAISEKQKGVLRTNCMDCLDRTNVCQSSFAKHMLDLQLREDGIDMSAQLDQETAWFNTLWADNGDAVSKQYASTAAMKGDYTRTRKRDYRGALNDLGLSLARFYNGMVNDYFSQTAIDFLLGNVTANVFDEFESDMMTKDPAVSISRMRQRAIDLCQKRVVADANEEVHGGWVLISPNSPDIVKSWPMEDVVLLLTDTALYLCRFDWDLEKVSSFERVHLGNVVHIKFGTYITSTVAPSHMDEMRNVGFVVEYQPGKSNVTRTNTRTLSTRGEIAPKSGSQSSDGSNRQSGFANFFSGKSKTPAIRKLAFKAPYTASSVHESEARPRQTELQQVVTICADIERLALERQLRKEGEEPKSIIEKGDIISLEAAKKNTGLLEQLGHSIKKLVWA
ncbi:SacI domain-containingprotein [Purpureocillium lavendulum]|uniref:SacI domain-containingprotein n=1 Tax=Purpureocillium lavendulum TaxID=1247861 RepID=A0AB34FLY0_9HYPO|nr:SacI domain-containingprotein [Purpureocillium lavendulum]